jgi:hypothetical protein
MSDQEGEGNSRRASSDGDKNGFGGAPTSPLTQVRRTTIFDGVKIYKGTDFPSLFREEGGMITKLEPGEGASWRNKMTGWCAAHGVKGVFALANVLVQLNEEGTKVLSLSADGSLLDDIGAQREILEKISGTAFGASVNLPSAAKLQVFTDDEARALFCGFTRISEQLSFLLAKSATPKNSMVTLLPDIFDKPDCASQKDGISHAFSGFIQLLQVDKRLSRDPQGTALQLKNKLLAGIKDGTSKGQSVTLYTLGHHIQEIGMQMTNIIQKQPTLSESLEMEINLSLCSAVRGICRTVRNNAKSPPELVDAAEVIGSEMTQKSITINEQTWPDFSANLLTLLATHLPPPASAASKERGLVTMTEAIALLASTDYEIRQKHRSQRGRDRHQGRTEWSSWTCNHCGNKGHHQSTCTNPRNPKADQMVLAAKNEAAAKRTERLALKGKRRRIQEASNQLADDDSSPPSPAKKAFVPKNAGSKEKPVTAGLARLHLHDDSLISDNAAGKPEYC